MTTTLRITADALRALEGAAASWGNSFTIESARPDGDAWLVPFTDYNAARLVAASLPGEDTSAAICRLCAKHTGAGLN